VAHSLLGYTPHRKEMQRDMAAPQVLDDRFEYSTTSPTGGVLWHNKYERVSASAPIGEKDLTFMEHVGYGVSYFELKEGVPGDMSPPEMASRVAMALPVDTPYDTNVSLLDSDISAEVHTPLGPF
jgi:hypothetical protein